MQIDLTAADLNWFAFAFSLPFTFELVGNDIAGETRMHGIPCKALFKPTVSSGNLFLKLDEVDAAGISIPFLAKSFVLSQIMSHAKAMPPFVSVKESGNGIVIALAGLRVSSAVVQGGVIVLGVDFA